MSQFKINRINVNFNFENILNSFSIVRFSTTDKYISYGSTFLDEVNLKFHTKSVVFEQGKSFYALFNKSDIEQIELSSKLRTLEDGESLIFETIESDKGLRDIPQHILAQLLINSISTPNHKRLSFNNLTGKLITFNPNHFSISRNKDKEQIFKIVGLEFKINPSLSIELNVRTFSSLLLKSKMDFSKKSIAKYPKYTFVHSTQTLRRVLNSDTVPIDELYILKQTSSKGREQKSLIPFLDFKSYSSFKDSKIGMLDEVLEKVKKSLSDYIEISLINVSTENVIRYSNSHFFKSNNLKITVVDAVKDEDSNEKVKLVSKEFSDLSSNFEVQPKTKSEQQLKLVHNKAFYEKYELTDPYRSSLDIQHITIEDFNTNSKASVKAVAYELSLKSDIRNEQISIIDWANFRFSNKWIFGTKIDDSFTFLSIYPNGKMEFQIFEPNLFNQNEYDELCDIFNENSEVEFLVKDHLGNINYISKTNGFSVPEYEILSEVLFKENNPITLTIDKAIEVVKELFEEEKSNLIIDRLRNVEHWNKESVLDCFDNRSDKKEFVTQIEDRTGEILKSYLRDKSRYEILDSQLDIHHFVHNNEHFYFVGVKGSGIQQLISRASKIRKISPYNNSKFIFDELLALMNVDFVKNGDLTVIPFPLKYLREWYKYKASKLLL